MLGEIISKNTVCHPDDILFNGREVLCTQCHVLLYPDINHLLEILNPYESVCVAQLFAQTTGDITNLRCKVPLEHLPGIFPIQDAFVQYDILVQSIHLLGTLNSNFIQYRPPFDINSSLNVKIIGQFVQKFSQMILQHKSGEDDLHVTELLKYIIEYMQKFKEDQSLIQAFCEIYAPYVSRNEGPLTSVHFDTQLTLEKFRIVNQNASSIRERFSHKSLHFEIIYVLVYIYLFVQNLDVIVNFVLDLLSKICRGYFVLPNRPYYEHLLDAKLNKTHNQPLRRRIHTIRTEGIHDHISVDLLKDIQTLYDLYSSDNTLDAYSLAQSFPYILFSNDPDYYAYMICLPVIKQGLDQRNGILTKNTSAKCRGIILYVKEFINQFNEFNGDGAIYWTSDTFKMFISRENSFKKSFEEFFNMFVVAD